MLIILRRTLKWDKGFKVILEVGTPEIIERRRFNGFKLVDDTDDNNDDEVDIVQDEQFDIGKKEKQKGERLPTAPTKIIN